ncbi:MAG: YnbE family lipoprotein [Desulfobacteraceae bacterium]|nr:YnbE family lipoprotein [Desulfobacteraceae bacterium]
MQKRMMFIILLLGFFVLPGCNTKHEVEVKPVEIKPIHITIDVNIKVDRALDDFFGDIDKEEDEIKDK